jgi:hypothetical protein
MKYAVFLRLQFMGVVYANSAVEAVSVMKILLGAGRAGAGMQWNARPLKDRTRIVQGSFNKASDGVVA